VLLEAMALEVPVVSTHVGGVPRLIQDDRNGVLIEPGSVESLTQGMARLLADRNLRVRLAAAGRQTVVEHHSFAARMQKIRAVYDDVLGGPVRLNPTAPPAVVPNLV
jgi:glycosyltransferase involved in cell wall biosynthesis